MHVQISKELEELFRREVAKRFSVKQGNMKKAFEEAIELWMKEKVKSSG